MTGHVADEETGGAPAGGNARASHMSLHPLVPVDAGSPLARSYIDFLELKPVLIAVIATFFVGTCVSIPFALQLFGKASVTWDPPPGSWADEQREAVKARFPEVVGASDYLVNIEWKDLKKQADITLDNPSFASLGLADVTLDALPFTGAGTKNFSEAVRQEVYKHWCNFPPQFLRMGLPPNCQYGTWGDRVSLFTGYWALHTYDPRAGEMFVASNSNRSTILGIKFQGKNRGWSDMDDDMQTYLEGIVGNFSNTFLNPVEMTASVFSLKDATKKILGTIEGDLALADGIAVPVTLLISMLALRNIRLMVIPLTMIVSTAFISMAIVTGVAEHVSVPVVCPLVMISIVVGLPVGHSLFLLNRFREGLLENEGAGTSYAVHRMLSVAGPTVFLSQLCLALCSALILFVDVSSVRGFGASIFVPVCISAMEAMILAPALLLAFPDFFGAAVERTSAFAVGRKRHTVALATQLKGTRGGYDGDESIVPHVVPELEDTHWHRYAAATQRATPLQACAVFFLLVAAVTPLGAYFFRSTNYTDSFQIFLPRRDKLTEEAQRIFADYGAGIVSQIVVVAVPEESSRLPADAAAAFKKVDAKTVVDKPVLALNFSDVDGGGQNYAFDSLGTFTGSLETSTTGFDPKGAVGAWYWSGVKFDSVSQSHAGNYMAQRLAAGGAPVPEPIDPKTGKTYEDPRILWRSACIQTSSLSPKAGFAIQKDLPEYAPMYWVDSAYMQVKLRIDPFAQQGRDFVKQLETLQTYFNEKKSTQLFLSGGAIGSASSVDRVMAAWRWLGPCYIVIAFVVLLLGTKSLVVAVRTVLTTFMTLAFSLGFTSVVYCGDALGWTSAEALSKFGEGDISYFVPIAGVPLIIGFCVSHEVFFTSAVQDWYHYHRLSTKESAKLGLIGVGWMNILSGFILAVSFVGHCFARLPVANQIAFAIFWALLFDVFVVRTFLVPVLMAPFGRINWYPCCDREQCEFLEECEQSEHRPVRSESNHANPLDKPEMSAASLPMGTIKTSTDQ